MNPLKIDVSASGDTTLVAAVSGRRIKVLSYVIVVADTVTVKFKSGSTDITGPFTFVSGGSGVSSPAALSSMGFIPAFVTAAGEALVINLSAAKQVGGHLTYILED
jgi:hypothetical protein